MLTLYAHHNKTLYGLLELALLVAPQPAVLSPKMWEIIAPLRCQLQHINITLKQHLIRLWDTWKQLCDYPV
jgi:hypothetical protein